jgi:hypothetical protein
VNTRSDSRNIPDRNLELEYVEAHEPSRRERLMQLVSLSHGCSLDQSECLFQLAWQDSEVQNTALL